MATIIDMPKLSDTMSVGTVVKWHKQIGDKVSEGDVLAEIETDKATMELENFENGVLLKVFVEEGVEVAIGSALAAVGEEGEVIEDIETPAQAVEDQTQIESAQDGRTDEEDDGGTTHENESPPLPLPEGDKDEFEGEAKEQTKGPTDRILASPLAKKIALEQEYRFKPSQGFGTPW